jgi:hypothetical protein
MTDKHSETVRNIITAATAGLPKRALGEIDQVDEQELLAALAAPISAPGVVDLGRFEIPGQKPGDRLIARRLRIGGRVVRFLAWPEV